jgi:hypothetical protein
LIQEHIAFRVWPLVESWEMPKETITKYSEGELVRLKYTFRYGDKFDEPNDDWLKCIEATSDELLGSYSKAEDNALSTAFGSRGKKRLNRVFDAIGFVYPDYRYPLWGQGKKRKAAALAALAETVPKAAGKKAEKSKTEGITKMPEILSPSTEATMAKTQKSSVTTPKRRRMANVRDVVLETAKTLNPAPSRKIAEASKAQREAETKQVEVEATIIQTETEAEPSEPTKIKPAGIEEKATEEKDT